MGWPSARVQFQESILNIIIFLEFRSLGQYWDLLRWSPVIDKKTKTVNERGSVQRGSGAATYHSCESVL